MPPRSSSKVHLLSTPVEVFRLAARAMVNARGLVLVPASDVCPAVKIAVPPSTEDVTRLRRWIRPGREVVMANTFLGGSVVKGLVHLPHPSRRASSLTIDVLAGVYGTIRRGGYAAGGIVSAARGCGSFGGAYLLSLG